ncbi:hypothetical protein D9613_010877 [Agrocybe pediades]|uniref:F-box domain-containing protein n=1 Tax=Agrocybe pediades TaxID=84607 RepID=A0A8H4VKM3_9AGAR|nr:hypothetical protein D9613_010877 [Agrocybe pediades]
MLLISTSKVVRRTGPQARGIRLTDYISEGCHTVTCKHAYKERSPRVLLVFSGTTNKESKEPERMDRVIGKILPRTGDEGYSPISVLHEDVLLQIFLANTAMSHTESRLATARLTSHVCRHWRAVMLRSPTIWGRLIDLEGLMDNTHDWMREVISRSGSALLWINGPIICGRIKDKTPTPEFILTLIGENWPRIQRLNISAVFQDVGNEDDVVYAQYWTTLLKRPAPRLEEFVFDYRLEPSRSRRSRWNSPAILFDSISPVLRKVRVYRIDDTEQQSADDRPEDLPLGMPVSWLSRLRFLSLMSTYKWNTFQLMRLLNATPFLEELEVFRVSTEDLEESDVQVIKLPQLTRFHFEHCDILDLVVLLESISPSSCCCLSLAHAHYPDSSALLSEYDELPYLYKLYSLVMKYLDAYFHQNEAKNVFLRYTYHEELLEVVDQTPLRQDEPSKRAHRFSISIPLEKWYAYLARDTLTDSTLFSSVEHLDIHDWYDHEDWSIWLGAFDSVTTLIASDDNIGRMMQEPHAQEPELPQLRVLQIGRPSEWPQPLPDVSSYCGEILPVFFRHRKEIGLPVTVLDLTAVKSYKLQCDLDNLEEFDGLLVQWTSATGRTKEYVCGSGRPENLRFAEERAVERPPRVLPDDPDRIFGWSGHL